MFLPMAAPLWRRRREISRAYFSESAPGCWPAETRLKIEAGASWQGCAHVLHACSWILTARAYRLQERSGSSPSRNLLAPCRNCPNIRLEMVPQEVGGQGKTKDLLRRRKMVTPGGRPAACFIFGWGCLFHLTRAKADVVN
jgi:hypothetical protein